MTEETQVSRFLTTLYDMVANNQFENCITWNPDQKSIRILDRIRFINEVLPYYFTQQTYQSFTRQLNMYGFIKKHNPKREIIDFYHSHFQLHHPELLRLIKRKSSVAHYQATLQEFQQQHKDSCSTYIESIESKLQSITHRQNDIDQHIQTLHERYELLETECFFLRMMAEKYAPSISSQQIQEMAKACEYDLPEIPKSVLDYFQ